jgi:hypothetical protein
VTTVWVATAAADTGNISLRDRVWLDLQLESPGQSDPPRGMGE